AAQGGPLRAFLLNFAACPCRCRKWRAPACHCRSDLKFAACALQWLQRHCDKNGCGTNPRRQSPSDRQFRKEFPRWTCYPQEEISKDDFHGRERLCPTRLIFRQSDQRTWPSFRAPAAFPAIESDTRTHEEAPRRLQAWHPLRLAIAPHEIWTCCLTGGRVCW